MIHTSHNIVVFSDGSSRGNPGPGGFGAIVVKHDDSRIHADRTQINADNSGIHVVELGGRAEHTTNNRMELQAAIKALEFLKGLTSNRERGQTLKIVVYSDSSYLINGITKWVHGWQKKGWKTANKKPVLNKDLWEQLLRYSTIHRTIIWKQIKGHGDTAGNIRADEIATAFADGNRMKLYFGNLPNYGIKNILEVPRDRVKGLTSNRERGQTLKKHSRAAAYSYVSMVGGVTQTHRTWAECEKRVKGKPARYKKAFSAEEEKKIIVEWEK